MVADEGVFADRIDSTRVVRSGMSRLYNFSGPTHAFQNAEKGQLKVSRIRDLNDPFELLPANLRNRDLRRAFQEAKRRAQSERGLVCLTETWQNPVMWSHYADKHRGVCLGFDVGDELTIPVTYEHDLLRVSASDVPAESSATDLFVDRFLRVKYRDWSYEQERRIIVDLGAAVREGELYFYPVSARFILREMILGARCKLSMAEARRIAASCSHPFYVTKARLAFTKFAVVEDKRFRNGTPVPAKVAGHQ